ncbi:unnamed protein product, partial [Urochloa humidicola]
SPPIATYRLFLHLRCERIAPIAPSRPLRFLPAKPKPPPISPSIAASSAV